MVYPGVKMMWGSFWVYLDAWRKGDGRIDRWEHQVSDDSRVLTIEFTVAIGNARP